MQIVSKLINKIHLDCCLTFPTESLDSLVEAKGENHMLPKKLCFPKGATSQGTLRLNLTKVTDFLTFRPLHHVFVMHGDVLDWLKSTDTSHFNQKAEKRYCLRFFFPKSP